MVHGYGDEIEFILLWGLSRVPFSSKNGKGFY